MKGIERERERERDRDRERYIYRERENEWVRESEINEETGKQHLRKERMKGMQDKVRREWRTL